MDLPCVVLPPYPALPRMANPFRLDHRLGGNVRVLAISLVLIAATALVAQTTVAQTTLAPTTTLGAETGNNTSAADSFSTQTNGNIGAGNISKQPIGSLLYPGSNTAVYAHFMAWFGGTNHMNVGYDSTDPAVVTRQVNDAISRGMAGFFEDWYGPNNTRPNTALFALKSEAELHRGFSFAVVYDR